MSDLERARADLAASGAIEVREDGERLAELADLRCEVHFEGKSSLIHLWSEARNLTRRLVRKKERDSERIILEVQRFGKLLHDLNLHRNPALTAGDRAIPDQLGITRQGRLVVIELKATENIQLPLQAVDYWLPVRRHQREADFARFGYFLGLEIDSRPPLVWLVASAFRFHSATEILLKYFSPEIQVTRIGLNENWRRGIKVMLRQ